MYMTSMTSDIRIQAHVTVIYLQLSLQSMKH